MSDEWEVKEDVDLKTIVSPQNGVLEWKHTSLLKCKERWNRNSCISEPDCLAGPECKQAEASKASEIASIFQKTLYRS